MIDYKKIEKLKVDKLGFFTFKKWDENKYLITNDIGFFCFLDNKDFFNFIGGNIGEINDIKHKELEDKLFINNETYKKELFGKFNVKNGFLKGGPTLHIMILTLRCNHACKYCHAYISNEKAKGKDMDIETAKRTVDTILYSTSNNLTIEFQGGEPLLNFEVLKFIVEYSREKAFHLKKNINYALVTNLSLMDDEKLEYLLQNNVSISTSLDGDEETHNFNRTFQKGNSYQKVVYWIKKINKEYIKRNIMRRVGALSTITKITLPKYKELIDAYIEAGLDTVFLRPMNPYGFAEKNFDELGYTAQEFNEFYNNAMDYIYELNKKGRFFKESLTTIYLQKILNNVDPNFLDERSPCGASVGQVAYNYNGKMYTCDEGRMLAETGDENFNIGEIGEDGKQNYINIIDNDVTKSMIKASITDFLPGYRTSVYKPYIGICPVYNYKASGNIFPNFSLDNRVKISTNLLDGVFSRIEDKEYLKLYKSWV